MPKVYIIEDDPCKREYLALLLKRLGSEWEAGFHNPEVALKTPQLLLSAARDTTGVVLLDILLKGTEHVAEEFVALVAKTPEGADGDRNYAGIGQDPRYRLASYVYAVCKHRLTPCFLISTAHDPKRSLIARDVFAPDGAISLPWPYNQTASWKLLPWRLLQALHFPMSRLLAGLDDIEAIMVSNAMQIRTHMCIYNRFRQKYIAFQNAVDGRRSGKVPWPGIQALEPSAYLFPSGDARHHLSNWEKFTEVPEDLAQALCRELDEMCQILPLFVSHRTVTAPRKPGSRFWPVAAAKGVHDGRISIAFIEWLLNGKCQQSYDWKLAIRLSDDNHIPDVLCALCSLRQSARNGKTFEIDFNFRQPHLTLRFFAEAESPDQANIISQELNKDPCQRAKEPGRRGSPGMATEARYKLQCAFPGQFLATSSGKEVLVSGQLECEEMK